MVAKNTEQLSNFPSHRLSSFSDHKKEEQSRNYSGNELVNTVGYMNTKSLKYSPTYSEGINTE